MFSLYEVVLSKSTETGMWYFHGRRATGMCQGMQGDQTPFPQKSEECLQGTIV